MLEKELVTTRRLLNFFSGKFGAGKPDCENASKTKSNESPNCSLRPLDFDKLLEIPIWNTHFRGRLPRLVDLSGSESTCTRQ